MYIYIIFTILVWNVSCGLIIYLKKTLNHASSWLFRCSLRYLKAAPGGDAADVRGRCYVFVSQSEIKFPKTEKQVDMETVSCVTCLQILFYTFIFISFIFKSSEASVAAGWTWTLNWYWTSVRLILSLCMTHINNWAVREKTAGSLPLLQLFLISDG